MIYEDAEILGRQSTTVGSCCAVCRRLCARTRGKGTLTLTLDRALEIALSDNPTIKVAEEEIALKKVTHKETWQNLLPQASIDGTWNHTISAAQMNLGGQSSRWVWTIRIR